MYLLNLFNEINVWRKVRKAAKEHEAYLNENGFRVDWIGRIYTVINLPEEVATHNPQIQQGYVLMQLRDYDRLFLQIGISDYIVPELERIKDAPAFLLILSPDREYASFRPFVYFLFRLGLYWLGLRIIYILFKNNWEWITTTTQSLLNLLS
jgi:hypothetical protein